MIRLGVAGHLGYDGLPDVLATLRRLAPTLGLQLSYEDTLLDMAGSCNVTVSRSGSSTTVTVAPGKARTASAQGVVRFTE